MANSKIKMKGLPNFRELEDTLAAYTKTDNETIKLMLHKHYPNMEMPAVPVRFFTNFKDRQANLYSKKFTRIVEMDQKLTGPLNSALLECEKYLHIFKKSALLIEPVGNSPAFKALDPTLYFVDYERDTWYFQDGDKTKVYILDNGKYDILSIDEKLPKALISLDMSLEDPFIDWIHFDTIDTLPFVEWTYSRIDVAQGDELVNLERIYILASTWGMYNALPKMVMHNVLNSDADVEKTKTLLANFMKTNKVLHIGSGSSMTAYDTGDIKVLVDVIDICEKLIIVNAVSLGVDKNAVVPTDTVQSGVAKIVESSYIEDVRDGFIPRAKEFDRRVFEKLEEMKYNIKKYEGITFHKLSMINTPLDNLTYAKEMKANGVFSFVDMVAYVFDISTEKAIERINKNGLKEQTFVTGLEGE